MKDTLYLIILPTVVMLAALYTAWTGYSLYDEARPRGSLSGFLSVIAWGCICMSGWILITGATCILDTVYPERIKVRIEQLQNRYDTIIKFRHDHE